MFIPIQFLDLIENLTFDGALQWLPKWIPITWYVHVSPCFNFASHYKNTANIHINIGQILAHHISKSNDAIQLPSK